MLQKKHVHLVFYDRYFRYLVSRRNRLDDIIDYGEVLIKEGLIEDGKLVDEKGFQNYLEKIVKQKKWKHAHVSLSVSDAFVSIRRHQVPNGLKKEEINAVLHREAQEVLRLPFQQPIITFDIIRNYETTVELLVFAYPKDVLQAFLNVFAAIHLKPIIADISSLALWRLYQEVLPDTNYEQDTLLMQWTKTGLVLAAFENGLLVFSRHVQLPVENRLWSWSFEREQLKWTGDEEELQALIDTHLVTMERFNDFYRYSVQKGNKGIEKIVLAGDFPYMDQARTALTSFSSLPVDALQNYLPGTIPRGSSDLAGLVIRGNSK
ncbi:type IV pilus biogenesis protein PilM [Gracilibacillus salinarum]|uniref:Pilus assembly protein PilM n=1 Tax=Gracilibacillus salinarum TaxID=2932255 RepID=A0ABY4GPV9_9BACI|nr:pilus assembly protein PilM [Gracilibacillus salinarum]UOQ86160.1 pilus assembly protein PilM [Gracilibacillus salinarum]